MFGGWSLYSVLIGPKNEDIRNLGRQPLTIDDVGAETNEDGSLEASEPYEVSVAPEPEINTKIELIPPANGSKEECVEPAVKQFPTPILGQTARKHGGLLLHVFIAVWMFIGQSERRDFPEC